MSDSLPWHFYLFVGIVLVAAAIPLGWVFLMSYKTDVYCIRLGYEGARGIVENVKGEEWVICTLRTIENKTAITLEHWLPYKP